MLNSSSKNYNINEADQDSEEFEENEITSIPPKLYSKRVILTFSILFSTIFGAAILMSNMKSFEQRKGRWQVLLFGIIYTIGQMITLTSFKSTNLSIPLNLAGGLILNEYFWNRYIGSDIEYLKKSWLKPAIISGFITLPFVFGMLYLGGKI